MPQVKERPTALKPQQRAVALRLEWPAGEQSQRGLVDTDARTVEIAFASETPCDMWYGSEILDCSPGAMRMGQRQVSLPLLFNHDRDDLLGVVERIWIDKDRVARAQIRFGRDERGDWAMKQCDDGVLSNVSFMYRVFKWIEDTEAETLTATDWEVYEISLVTIPADPTVGAGRNASTDTENGVQIVQRSAAATAPSRQASGASQAPEAQSTSPQETESPEMFKKHRLMNAVDALATGGGAAGGTTNQAAGADLVAAERKRTEEIVALGRHHSLGMDLVHGMIQRGLSIGEARGEVLDLLMRKDPAKPVADLGASNGPDLTEKEKRAYSFLRAIQAQLSGDWTKAGFERECSVDIAKRTGKETNGFFIPNNLPFAPTEEHARAYQAMSAQGKVAYRSPYVVGTATQGGNLVQTQLMYENFIEVLRNQLVTAILGARYLTGLTGNVDIPRQISQTTTYWLAERGAPTEAEATFDKVSLRPKTVGALSLISRLMLLQSTPAIEMLARQDLLAVIALAIDLAAISGSGASNQPTGIVNQSGVGSVVGGTNGANLSFDHLIQLKYATKFANAPQGAAGFAMNSKAIGYLSTLKASTGQYLWDPQGGLTAGSPDRVKGSPYAESQQLRSTLTKGTSTGVCSELVYGNWQELFIAMWGVTEVMLNPYDSAGFQNGDVLLRAFQTCDIGVRHGASFSVMSDALTPGF